MELQHLITEHYWQIQQHRRLLSMCGLYHVSCIVQSLFVDAWLCLNSADEVVVERCPLFFDIHQFALKKKHLSGSGFIHSKMVVQIK